MGAQQPPSRAIFVRDPIHLDLHLPQGRTRHVVVHRLPARHYAEMDDFWASLPAAIIEVSKQQAVDQVITFVKAAIPEPREGCAPTCACAGNAGIHDDIDLLGYDELQRLYDACASVNSPKGLPDRPDLMPAASGVMKRSLARLSLGSIRALLSTSPSRSSATSRRSARTSASRSTPPSPATQANT